MSEGYQDLCKKGKRALEYFFQSESLQNKFLRIFSSDQVKKDLEKIGFSVADITNEMIVVVWGEKRVFIKNSEINDRNVLKFLEKTTKTLISNEVRKINRKNNNTPSIIRKNKFLKEVIGKLNACDGDPEADVETVIYLDICDCFFKQCNGKYKVILFFRSAWHYGYLRLEKLYDSVESAKKVLFDIQDVLKEELEKASYDNHFQGVREEGFNEGKDWKTRGENTSDIVEEMRGEGRLEGRGSDESDDVGTGYPPDVVETLERVDRYMKLVKRSADGLAGFPQRQVRYAKLLYEELMIIRNDSRFKEEICVLSAEAVRREILLDKNKKRELRMRARIGTATERKFYKKIESMLSSK